MCPLAWRRTDFYRAANLADSFLHTEQTEASALLCGAIESAAVIHHESDYPIVCPPNRNIDVMSGRVPRHVGQRLLHDSIYAGAVGVGKLIESRVNIRVDLDSAWPAHFLE